MAIDRILLNNPKIKEDAGHTKNEELASKTKINKFMVDSPKRSFFNQINSDTAAFFVDTREKE